MSIRTGGISVLFFERSVTLKTGRKGVRIVQNSNIYKYVQLFIFSLVIGGARMESKNITLKVNSKLYDTYREICKKEGWIVSRQFEKCMEEELKKRGREI